jgi:parvulin-like peptidyl-prolyl isomerase
MVWDMLRKNNFSKPPKPLVESFGDMAAQYSVEASSRANRGLVPPVKMHGGQPLLEAEAFSLKPGELSSIIQVDDKFVILLCDGRTEPVQPDFNAVRDIIRDDIREKKLNLAMKECLQRLQDGSSIDNFLAGTSKSPKKADQGRFPAETLRPGAIDRK